MDSAAESSENLLHREVQYHWTETRRGTWRRYMYSDGSMFAEYVASTRVGRLPLVHVTWGVSPETGRRLTAVGIVAIGRRATGVVAVGQLAVGLVAIGQLALGVVFGLGQAATGAAVLGQAAFGAAAAVGQFAYSAYVTIAQFGAGHFVLAQLGYGTHVIDSRGVDPAAKEFFLRLVGQ